MSDVVDRLNAALTGRYAIDRQIGEGGMATVYLAHDVKHDRRVAVKVLRPELAAMVGAERFLSEIRTTANLQHPHILPLHDSGDADGFLFYVMPYVDGETLRARIEREKQLGVSDAVAIARKVASALDYAHGQGVVHRDIKPANILLSGQGEPLVADFGIALAVAHAGAGRITETGLSLGTPHYMSPEQATGDRDVDPRSDVYALACVLYEMLAGQPPFSASTAQAVLVQILTSAVAPVTSLRRTVPPNIEAALSRALEKLPADRFAGAADFARALDDPSFTYEARPATASVGTGRVVSPPAAAGRPWLRDPRSVAALAALAVVVAVAAFALFRPAGKPVTAVPTRARLTGLDIQRGSGGWRLAISPGGDWIAAAGAEGGDSAIHVRPAHDPAWRPLPFTEGGTNPAFSPDGQSIAFSVSDGIRRVPLAGGPALPVATEGSSPHWTADGMIVYDLGGQILRVPASGGEPEVLFASDSIRALRPHMLPGGRGVLFGESTVPDPLNSRVLVLDLGSGEVRVVAPSGNQPRYVPTGHVVYGYGDQALMAVGFDLETMEATGSPFTVLPSLTVYSGGASQFDVSETGTLVYDAGGDGLAGRASEWALLEVGVDGVEAPLPIVGVLQAPRYSPDGGKIAYSADGELRVYDVVTGASPQISSGGGQYPVWSGTGDDLYFGTGVVTAAGIARRRADASDAQTLLADPGPSNAYYVNDVAPDDGVLLVREGGTGQGVRDLKLARPDGDSLRWEAFLTARWNEGNGDISPDGRWVVYQSDETGEPRIFAHTFPVPTGQRAVSPGRGTNPVWSPDGRTIYYILGDSLMAVEVALEPAFAVSPPRALFDLSTYDTSVGRTWQRSYDIHPDGNRFLFVAPLDRSSEGRAGGDALTDINIVVNWFEELKARMGG